MENEQIKPELHSIGIKNTPKKGVILKIMSQTTTPINATKLHLECKKELDVDIVTIYRTLAQFKEKGIVREFLGSDGLINYEYTGNKPLSHPHFQCDSCHSVYCLGELGFDDGLYFSNMAKRHRINRINITLSGVCESCQNQNKEIIR